MNAAAITPRIYRAPLTVRAVAKTDSTNLRLYWHIGEIILNWECSVRELRVHDPHTGDQQGLRARDSPQRVNGTKSSGKSCGTPCN